MSKIKITSIGSGWVVSNRHIPSLYKNDKFQIVAIVGRQEEKLKNLALKYKIPKYYTGDATKNTEWLKYCDAVMIGADPLHHYELAKFCLVNGKHVLMEKPFTVSFENSKELVSIAEKKKLKFAIVHNMQYSRAVLNLDKDIQKGKLGEIKSITAFQFGNQNRRLPTWYDKLPWGLYFDESPHLIYLLDKYGKGLKLINSVKYNSTRGLNTPALVTAHFKTKINVPATLYLNFETPISEWFFLLSGDKQIGVVDLFRDIYFSIPNDNRHKAFDILNTSKYTIQGHLKGTFLSGLKVLNKSYFSGFEKVIEIYAESILYNKPLAAISGKEALNTNKLQFHIIKKAFVLNP